MTALHVLCCDPNTTIDQVRSAVEADPSAVAHRDITGKIPLQRFLLSRDFPDVVEDGESNDNNNNNGEEEGGGEVEGSLPSLIHLLENGIKGKDLDIIFVLKNEYQDDLLISDNATKLVPFMSAATMLECGLDVVYSLAMKNLQLLRMQNDSNKRRKIN